MALLTDYDVRVAARTMPERTYATADTILRKSRDSQLSSFDVFLSHAKLDSELVLGVKAVLETAGQSVYVDWVDDPLLDRTKVTPATADQIRRRMRQCASLIYVYSRNATVSRWMPWELGYFDAYNGNVAVLPIVQSATETTHKGEEFVGLYPYVDVTGGSLYIHRSAQEYAGFRDWRSRSDKLRPAA
jgi:hypothetical protein